MEPNQTNIEENKNINFFKKIWYSITKISKYDEMIDLGCKKAIKYFFGLLAILSIILTICAIFYLAFSGAEELSETELSANLYIYYACIYFLAYFIILFLIYGIYILLISICMSAVLKIFKMEDSFKNTLSLTIYSSTLSIIIYVIYLIISYFSGFVIPSFDFIAALVVFIYIGLNFRKKRGDTRNVFYRRNKKKSKK